MSIVVPARDIIVWITPVVISVARQLIDLDFTGFEGELSSRLVRNESKI